MYTTTSLPVYTPTSLPVFTFHISDSVYLLHKYRHNLHCTKHVMVIITMFSYRFNSNLHCIKLIRDVLQLHNYTVPKEIDFPRYNMKCSRENVILRGIFHVVYHVFIYISCYIVEIWIAFLTVYSVHCTNLLLNIQEHSAASAYKFSEF